jgi:amino acid adenylation domain-containing protein/non-ribosomal peptide synthase protein (TIGR01720 family)
MKDLGYGDSEQMNPEGESRSVTRGAPPTRKSAEESRSAAEWRRESNLTAAQRLIWLGLQLNPDTPIYNMIHASTIYGPLDWGRFENAFQQLVDESDAFRTIVRIKNGVPQQLVAEKRAADLELVDFSTEPDPEAAYQKWLAIKKREVLDAGKCLYSTALVKLTDDRFVWYLCLSHLIADAQSFALAYRHVASAYQINENGESQQLSPLPRFSDYVQFEKQFYGTDGWKKSDSYWRSLIEKHASTNDMYGVPRQPDDGRIQRLEFPVGAERSEKIRRIASTRNFSTLSVEMSLSSIWTTLISVLLHRVNGGATQRLAMPFQARPTPQFKETIGPFVEVGAVSVDFDGLTTFQSLHGQVLRKTIDALRFARPGISSAELNRSCSVRLNYVTAQFDDFAGFPVKTDWIHSGYGDTNQPLQVQVCDFDQSGEVTLYLDVAERVFVAERQVWLTDQLNAVIDAFIEDPLRSVGSFDLLSKEDRNQLLVNFNATAREYGHSGTILAPFQEVVARAPNDIAVTDGERSLTYRELDEQSSAVGSYLQSIEVGKGQRVAICMRRSLDTIVAMLGALKSGAAFCPFDHAFPMKRKSELLDDLQPSAVFVSDESSLDPSIARRHRVYRLAETVARGAHVDTNAVSLEGNDAAYLIYTSGSTGKPKAAMLSHMGLANYICWAADTYAGGQAMDFPLYSSLAFDLTLTSVFVPLVCGGKVRIYTDSQDSPGLEVLSVFAEDKVDIVKLTPSHMELLRQQGVECSRICKLIVGGEELKTNTAKALIDMIAGVEIYNEYGPTEATVGCMVHCYDPEKDQGSAVPIGVPAANMGTYIRDQYDQPAARGVTGEMVVAGTGVALEYWNRSGLTAQKFSVDRRTGQRQYRTGDLARWQSWGIQFLGRADDQVKLRGVRVELGELEAHLLDHHQVESAAVVVRSGIGDDPLYDESSTGIRNEPQLVAYFVSESDLSSGSLKRFLESRLPSYMLPQHLVRLDALPLTQNGKVDRKALPNPVFSRGDLDTQYIAASTPLQHQLVSIWRDVLEVHQVGVEDNFFELGGDSVMCIQVCARSQEQGLDLIPRMLFQNPTIALLAGRLESKTPTPAISATSGSASISVSDADIARIQRMLGSVETKQFVDVYPLTPTQSGMLFHCLSSFHRSMYVGQVAGSIDGNIDIAALYRAYAELVAGHPALRTRFFWQGLDDPLQVVCAPDSPHWEVLDWSSKSTDIFENDFDLLRTRIRDEGFDLADGPPVRMTIVIQSDSNVRLIWTTHHILFDGWSVYPLFDEWLARYGILKGERRNIRPTAPFRNYVAWLRNQNESKSREFWRQQLAGLDEPTTLPLGADSGASSENRVIHEVRLDRKTTEALEHLARRKRVTLNAVFQSAWAILLQRYCDTNDIVFGATHSGRNANVPGVDRMVGLFINTLPVHLRLDRDITFEAWVPDVHQKLLNIGEFEYSSLAEIQRHAGVSADNTLFDSIVVFENYPKRIPTQIAGMSLGPLSFTTLSHYPLAVLVYPGNELTMHFEFDDARFTEQDMSMLGGHMTTLLEAIAADPSRSIHTLPMLVPAELPAVSGEAQPDSQTDDYPRLHELIAERAAADASSIAVRCGKDYLDYRGLAANAKRIASGLIDMGVQRGDRVGLIASRTPLSIAGILGIMEAAAAFVPLDPNAPAARIAEIVSDAGISIVLSDGQADVPNACDLVPLRELIAASSPSPRLPTVQVAADDIAYVLYTSGSTGRPKGVMVTHSNIAASTLARTDYYPGRVQTFLHVSPLAFDSAMAGLFWTLIDGGVVLFPEAGNEQNTAHLLGLIEQHRATHILALARFYDVLLDAAEPNAIASLQVAIVAGEACPPDLYARHRTKTVACNLYNEYGPTEATVWSHVFRFPDDFNAPIVPIGDPIKQMRHFVVDQRLRPVPPGVPGELLLAGPGIASGYLGQETLTREKFLRLPDATGLPAGLRIYRTGDRVRIREDGGLDFLGRVDHQLKIRGFRVEPQEIENVMTGHPAVMAAAVVESPGNADVRRLIVGVYEGRDTLASETLRQLISNSLPNYMVPDRFHRVDSMPRLSNGKIDRRCLSQGLKLDVHNAKDYEAPQSDLETQLADIWETLFKVDQVGRDDNFLDLGGDSILALQVVSRARRYGIEARPKDVIDARSLAAFAKMCSVTKSVRIEPARHQGQLTPIEHWFFEFDRGSFDNWNMSAALKLRKDVDLSRLQEAFQNIFDRHSALRTPFLESESSWSRGIPVATEQLVIEQINLPESSTDLGDAAVQDCIELLQTSLDIRKGRLFRLARLRIATEEWLFVIVHHLAIDAVSWSILLDEVDYAYADPQAAQGREPGDWQFGNWAGLLSESTAAGYFDSELDYWSSQRWKSDARQAHMLDAKNNLEASSSKVIGTVTAALTKKLLTYASDSSAGLTVEVFLLTAMSRALSRRFDLDAVLIGIESYGRHDFGSGVDLSSIIGWFTASYPLLINLDDRGDLVDDLKQIKQARQSVPNNGVGFGALKYLHPDKTVRSRLASVPEPLFGFNYLGKFDPGTESSIFTGFEGPLPFGRSSQAKRPCAIELVAEYRECGLQLRWNYSRDFCDENHVMALMQETIAELQAISDSLDSDIDLLTPADFPLAGLDQSELDDLLDDE